MVGTRASPTGRTWSRLGPASPVTSSRTFRLTWAFTTFACPTTRAAQADLAATHRVDGFVYYHYWFAGRRLLERPFDEVLDTGRPDQPFALCWANENWTRRWDGQDASILLQQSYSEDDDRRHGRWLTRAFRDERYIRVDGKPLFLVYRAGALDDARRTTRIWRDEARKAGVGEIYLCRVESAAGERSDPTALGFDAATEFAPDWTLLRPGWRRFAREAAHRAHLVDDPRLAYRAYDYDTLARRMLAKPRARVPAVSLRHADVGQLRSASPGSGGAEGLHACGLRPLARVGGSSCAEHRGWRVAGVRERMERVGRGLPPRALPAMGTVLSGGSPSSDDRRRHGGGAPEGPPVRIAVYHNLPPGGALRVLYDFVPARRRRARVRRLHRRPGAIRPLRLRIRSGRTAGPDPLGGAQLPLPGRPGGGGQGRFRRRRGRSPPPLGCAGCSGRWRPRSTAGATTWSSSIPVASPTRRRFSVTCARRRCCTCTSTAGARSSTGTRRFPPACRSFVGPAPSWLNGRCGGTMSPPSGPPTGSSAVRSTPWNASVGPTAGMRRSATQGSTPTSSGWANQGIASPRHPGTPPSCPSAPWIVRRATISSSRRWRCCPPTADRPSTSSTSGRARLPQGGRGPGRRRRRGTPAARRHLRRRPCRPLPRRDRDRGGGAARAPRPGSARVDVLRHAGGRRPGGRLPGDGGGRGQRLSGGSLGVRPSRRAGSCTRRGPPPLGPTDPTKPSSTVGVGTAR